MGNGVSHAGGDEEGEAGNLDSFGDLTEVYSNVVLECLLENQRLSQVLCLSHRDLGCPVNPAFPLQVGVTQSLPRSAEIGDDNPLMVVISAPKSALLASKYDQSPAVTLPDLEFTDVQCNGFSIDTHFSSFLFHYYRVTRK